MADKNLSFRYNSDPGDVFFVLENFRDEEDPRAVVNITGYAFKLIIKRDLNDADSEALFDITGAIHSAVDGKFKFTLGTRETTIAPGSYVGEIRWWSGGAPGTGEPPDDVLSVNYIITPPIRRDEP